MARIPDLPEQEPKSGTIPIVNRSVLGVVRQRYSFAYTRTKLSRLLDSTHAETTHTAHTERCADCGRVRLRTAIRRIFRSNPRKDCGSLIERKVSDANPNL